MRSQNHQPERQKAFSQKSEGVLHRFLYARHWTSLVGYGAALLLMALAFLIGWIETVVDIHDYVIGIFFAIGTLLIGWFWGMGPASLALVIGILCIDYLAIPPIHTFTFYLWPGLISLLPFIILQLCILWLISRQKHDQLQLLLTQQKVSQYAEQLAIRNQELAHMNMQLEQADRMKDQFLSMASHELKTPLTTVQGQIQLVLRRLLREPELPANYAFLPGHLEKAVAQTYRLRALVDDLLNLSSLRSGKVPLRVAPCDLNRLCRDISGDLSSLENRPIEVKAPPGPVILQADEGRLSQVINNLLTNALKYSPAHMEVQIEVQKRATEAVVIVHNERPVLSREQLEVLFEPFYRSPEAQKSVLPGWGLGLAISKEIVEQHGGRIWAESSAEKGTTFFVTLPY